MQTIIRFSLLAPFFPVCLGLAVGIVAADWLDIAPPAMGGMASFLFAAVSVLLYRRINCSAFRYCCLLLVFICLGMGRHFAWRAATTGPGLDRPLPATVDSLRAVVLAADLKPGRSLVVGLQEIYAGEERFPAGGKLLLRLPWDSKQDLVPGQMLILKSVLLGPVDAPRNPGQFDFRRFMQRRGILASIRVRNDSCVVIDRSQWQVTLESGLFYPLRRRAAESLDIYLQEDPAALLKALLLGMRAGLAEKVREDFARAGMIHVLAISGLHVGFIAVLLSIVCSFFPLRRSQRNMLVIVGLFFYMLLVAANPPVVRATLMAVLYLLAQNMERRCNRYSFVWVAISVLLLLDPQQLFRLDFQFSCGAVLSILFFYPRVWRFCQLVCPRRLSEGRAGALINDWLLTPIAVSVAAQIAAMPLTAWYFQQISPLAALIGIVIVPFTALLVVVGTIVLMTAMLDIVLVVDIAFLFVRLVNIYVGAVEWSAQIPFANVTLNRFGGLELWCYTSLVILVFLQLTVQARRVLFVSLFFSLLFLLLPLNTRHAGTRLLVLDVGQGDASLIITPTQKTIGIDAGPASEYYDAGKRVVVPALRYLGSKTIDHLFVSHAHLDHVGGAFQLVAAGLVKRIYLPQSPLNGDLADSLIQLCVQRAVPYSFLAMGEVVEVDAVTRVYVLGPSPVSQLSDNVNDHSLLLQVVSADRRLLFTGDLEAAGENAALCWGDLLKSDFLKVAHHGSRTSSSEAFIDLVSPGVATISCGRENRFSHPSPQSVVRLKAYSNTLLQTALQGAILLDFKNDRITRVLW